MENYLYDADNRLIGTVKKSWHNKYTLYDKNSLQLGYYDEDRNQTYDSYGSFLGDGNLLADLPYTPHRLRFPLPDVKEVSFTRYHIKRAGNSRRQAGYDSQYLDDGKCSICTRNGNQTCHVQGLPGMCKTCYRFFALYSQKDVLGLEKSSEYRPITVRQIQEAVEKTKAPLIEAKKAADAMAKAALFQTAMAALDAIAENAAASGKSRKMVDVQPQKMAGVKNKPAYQSGKEKKNKKRLRWYHWVLLFLLGYYLVCYVLIPLALYMIFIS